MTARTGRQKAVAKALTALLPMAPYADMEEIREAALARHMRDLPPGIATWLATVAHVRHRYTDYDELRDQGYDKESARHFTAAAINDKLTVWRATRLLDPDGPGNDDGL